MVGSGLTRAGRFIALFATAMLLCMIDPHAAQARTAIVPRDVVAPIATVTREELEKLPVARSIADILALQPGEPVVVKGRQDGIRLRGLADPRQSPYDLTGRVGTAEGGDVTVFEIPKDIRRGRWVLQFNSNTPNPIEQPVTFYAYLDAYLDREKLRSGQRAQFRYDLDFGEGPGEISMTITTAGPIHYAKNGQPQVLQVGRDGKARLSDYITALRGSPTGIPFAITPSFGGLRIKVR